MTSADWRFVRKPVWIAGHVVALAAIVVFVMAGFWQLDRHQQRVALEAEVEQRLAAPTVPFDSVGGDDPSVIRYRRVTATGVFATDEEVILALQPRDGIPGHHVLTPLVTSPGEAILVDRGWVPLDFDQPADPRFSPPEGTVAIEGYVRTTQTRGRSVPADGELTQIGRVDLDRLQRQVSAHLAPVFLQLAEPIVGSGELPEVVPLAALAPPPPHLSYAVQWFLFAGVVVVGYAILMRRTSRTGAT